MRKVSLCLAVALLFSALPRVVRAGEWSADQKEVWNAIEACGQAFEEKNKDAILDCIHDDFRGWLYTEPVPRGKASFEKVGMHLLETRDVVASERRPIDIMVYGDFAIIHYFFIDVTKNQSGEESYEQGRWTDIMIREDGKWRWIADHGGVRPK